MFKFFSKSYKFLIREKNGLLYNLRLKHIISRNSDLLSEGEYALLTCGKTIVYLKNEETTDFISKHYKNLSKNYRKGIVPWFDLFFKFRVANSQNKKQGENFSGQLIMMTLNGDTKIFDFETCRVLTKHQDEEKFCQIKLAFDVFNPTFDHTILYFSKNNYLIEELIGKKENQRCYDQLTDFEKNDVFQDLMLKYTEYFNQLDSKSIQYLTVKDICEKLKDEVDEKIYARIERILLIPSFESVLHPRVFLHGDLHFGNILIDDKRAKLIDFERSGNYVFIYDFFNFICEETVLLVEKNYLFLKEYYNGSYDDLLLNMFAQFEMIYSIDKKIEYLMLFLSERILKRGFNRKEHAFLNEIERLYSKRK